MNARQRFRRFSIDGTDRSMSVGTAHECRFEHVGSDDIINVPALAPQECRVLQPIDTASIAFCFGHQLAPVSIRHVV